MQPCLLSVCLPSTVCLPFISLLSAVYLLWSCCLSDVCCLSAVYRLSAVNLPATCCLSAVCLSVCLLSAACLGVLDSVTAAGSIPGAPCLLVSLHAAAAAASRLLSAVCSLLFDVYCLLVACWYLMSFALMLVCKRHSYRAMSVKFEFIIANPAPYGPEYLHPPSLH
jgi:hypothetical protein